VKFVPIREIRVNSIRVHMNSIVLLSGPVGAGKSTVAKELIALSTGPVAYIEGDTFWSFIAKGAGGTSNRNFKMVMTAMMAAAVPYALYGNEVILDFSIPPWFLETAIKIVKNRAIALHYVVLRPSEKVCAARAATRHEGKIADYKLYHDLYTSFNQVQRYIIPDDTSDPLGIAQKVREGLDDGIFMINTNNHE
jgi:chloramphenicol 3-O-phosphotransferase